VTIAAGTRLGPYEIEALIVTGGMGEVYRARDVRLDRTVAVKVLSQRVLTRAESRKRFEREARVVASLNHAHICALHDVGQHDGLDFLVMEFVRGETLAARLARGALPLDLVLRHASEIAAALIDAHRAGVVHRDLKPANIMLTDAGVKLLDFGLAKLQSFAADGDAVDEPTVSRHPDGLTSEGVIVGTFQYMAPEQLEGRSVDARTDLFAFGAVIYEMATGQRAFQGKSQASLIAAILTFDPPPISALQPIAPPGLDRLVHKCLAKDPNQRWQTSRDLADELKWIGTQSSTTVATPPARRALSGLRPPRVGRRVILGLIAVLAVAAALLGVWLRSNRTLVATKQRPVTDYQGSHGFASLSPDATMVAFSSETNAETPDQIWVKNIQQGDPIQVTFGDVRAIRPTWSPRGDQIVFARPGQGLWSIPPLGGQPRQLSVSGRRPRFSADGRRLVFLRGQEIWIANADGSQPQRVLTAPFVEAVALSPSGESIAFFQTTGGPAGDLWTVSASGGTPRRMTFDETAGGHPVWTPDGRTIIFPSARSGSVTLWQVRAEGGSPRPLTFGAGSDVDPDISLDGRTLVYTNVRTAFRLVINDPATGEEIELLERRATPNAPTFSPTGDRIAFFQETDKGVHLFTVRTDGKELRQITAREGEVNIFPRWSADGSFIYFFQAKPTVSLRRIPVAGGDAIEIGPWPWQSFAAVDPLGARVAYMRQANDKTLVTVVHDRGTGRETTLESAIEPSRWSRDGRTIFGTHYTGPSDSAQTGKIVACAADGPCRTLVEGNAGTPSHDDTRIFFLRNVRPGGTDRELWSVDSDGRNLRKVAVIGPWGANAVVFDVSPDGRIVRPRPLSSEHRLWLADLR
jgi:serine/threonine protein kinase